MGVPSWPPQRRSRPLEVALPASVLSVEQDLRDKTYKVGLISRALAVFRVDVVHIYMDEDSSEEDLKLMKDLLEYQLVPPHLKREVVPVKETLRYAGLMPPLRLPNHVVPERPRLGDLIDVLIKSNEGGKCRVYMGHAGEGLMEGCGGSEGDVVTAQVAGIFNGGSGYLLRPASWGRVYSGYRVSIDRSLGKLLERLRAQGYVTIGTSRYGSVIGASAATELQGRPIVVAFGGPGEGLLNEVRAELFDLLINAVPSQGTETVRTEEALLAALTIINYLIPE